MNDNMLPYVRQSYCTFPFFLSLKKKKNREKINVVQKLANLILRPTSNTYILLSCYIQSAKMLLLPSKCEIIFVTF